jgi:hypothetical protein
MEPQMAFCQRIAAECEQHARESTDEDAPANYTRHRASLWKTGPEISRAEYFLNFGSFMGRAQTFQRAHSALFKQHVRLRL